MAEARRLPTWAYVVAAIVGSFLGTLVDALWLGGGFTMTKIMAVAVPALLWIAFGRSRSA